VRLKKAIVRSTEIRAAARCRRPSNWLWKRWCPRTVHPWIGRTLFALKGHRTSGHSRPSNPSRPCRRTGPDFRSSCSEVGGARRVLARQSTPTKACARSARREPRARALAVAADGAAPRESRCCSCTRSASSRPSVTRSTSRCACASPRRGVADPRARLDYYENFAASSCTRRVRPCATAKSWTRTAGAHRRRRAERRDLGAGPRDLAWAEVEAGGRGESYNVVAHELGHKIDMSELRRSRRRAAAALGMRLAEWTAAFDDAYESLLDELDRGKEPWLDPYAARTAPSSSRSAPRCSSTCRSARARVPDVYAQLAAFYTARPREARHGLTQGLTPGQTQSDPGSDPNWSARAREVTPQPL